MNYKIPLFRIYSDKKDIGAVSEIIKSGISWAEGKSIKQFEEDISRYSGMKYAAVFNSGTSALHAALLAYGIGKGDEVIVPSFTFIATANAPLFVGAKPVFADIDEDTLGLDPKDIERKITPRTKAVIPIHYGGCPCRINLIKKICHKHRLILIEDAAEAFGARVGKKLVGTFSDAAMLSFCQNKIITTGEGGAIVTNSRTIYEKLRLIRSHGRSDKDNYFLSSVPLDYVDLGYNFRMSTILAALGRAQLTKVDKIISSRRRIASYLNKQLAEVKEIIALPLAPKGYFHVYQLYSIRVKGFRDQLMRYLAKKGIMGKIYFNPVHLSSFYRKKLKIKCRLPVTEKIAKETLTLPLYPGLTNRQIHYLVRSIKAFFKEKKR